MKKRKLPALNTLGVSVLKHCFQNKIPVIMRRDVQEIRRDLMRMRNGKKIPEHEIADPSRHAGKPLQIVDLNLECPLQYVRLAEAHFPDNAGPYIRNAPGWHNKKMSISHLMIPISAIHVPLEKFVVKLKG